MCGGTAWRPESVPARRGLSPRVRGNQVHPAFGAGFRGSIPACAGEPPLVIEICPTTTVYPRVCGGTSGCRRRGQKGGGLSPRVRGNPRCWAWRNWTGWSIPACAGEPGRAERHQHLRRVYPRVCGGTVVSRCVSVPKVGLSPRVRGNPDGIGGSPGAVGSIPACAGEPIKPRRCATNITVYPRVCGGTR